MEEEEEEEGRRRRGYSKQRSEQGEEEWVNKGRRSG